MPDESQITDPVQRSVRFSVIAPTHNRPVLLDRLLLSLCEMEYPQSDFEVLVVDDGSRPPAAEVFARYADRLPLRTFRTEGGGPARARNLALRAAVGEYVVFTDDDCRVGTQWLSALAEAIEQYPGAGFGGSIVDSPENSIYGRTSQILVSFLYDWNETNEGLRFFCSNNLAFPRVGLLAMGGFDESFPLAAGEDRYICTHWLKHSPMEFVPRAVIEHRQFLGFKSFVRQQFRYGRGACQFWCRRFAEDGAVNRVQPYRFYWDLLTYPFGRVPFVQAVAMLALLLLSQIAGVTGYYMENSKAENAARG